VEKIPWGLPFSIYAGKCFFSLTVDILAFAFYGYVELLRLHIYILILSMRAEQSTPRIIINCILYFSLILLIDDFLSTLLSGGNHHLISDTSDRTSLIAPISNENKTCSQRLDERLASLEILTRP
jgi:hypothetical protein